MMIPVWWRKQQKLVADRTLLPLEEGVTSGFLSMGSHAEEAPFRGRLDFGRPTTAMSVSSASAPCERVGTRD